MKLAGLVIADRGQCIDRKKCREASDRRGQRSQHPEFRAIVTILGIECVPHEAAIAGAKAKEAHLALELHGSSRHEGNSQVDAGIADGKPRREIVAAVDDQVVAFNEPCGIVGADALLDRGSLHEMVQAMHELKGEIRFGITRVPLAKERLAMKVAEIHDVRIDDRQSTHPGARKGRNDGTADPPGPNHADAGRLQFSLPGPTDLRKDNVPRVSLELGVGKVHCPVDPKPPMPRRVSLSASTSRNCALNTGPGTS